MNRSVLWLSTAVLSALALFAQGESGPAGTLAYRHGGNIWVKSLPDGAEKQISQGGGTEYPQWSVSGQWLSFRQNEKWIVTPANGDPQQMHVLEAGGPPEWSPLHDEVAFVAPEGLCVVSFDGNVPEKRVVLRGRKPGNIGDLAWSPDGTRFAFLMNGSLWRANSDGSDAQRLFSPGGHDSLGVAGWSSDGRYILFRIDPDSSASLAADGLPLFSISVDGGRAHALASNVFVHSDSVSVAPGRAEVLASNGCCREAWADKRLTLVDPATGRFTLISTARSVAVSPVWSPDGREIAYVSAPENEAATRAGGGEPAKQALAQRRIWIMNADGKQMRQMTSDSRYRDEYPLWSRDGQHILFTRMDQQDNAGVWTVRLSDGALRKIVDEVDDENPVNTIVRTFPNAKPFPAWFGYYGYIHWNRYIAWHPQ